MHRRVFQIVLALTCVAALWRFVDIGRDPDVVTESSQDAWGDPASYLYNARSHVLFGDWRVSEGVTMFAAPGYTLLASLCLATFGVDFRSTLIMAMLSGFAVIAATALFAGTASRLDGDLPPRYAAAAAAVLLLGSYIVFAHQHVPNGDMEALAVSSLAALCLAQLQSIDPNTKRLKFRALAVLGGFGIGMAPFVKLHNGIFAISAVAAWVVSYYALDEDWRSQWRAATPWLAAGAVIAISAWVGWALWIYRISAEGALRSQLDRLRIFSVLTARPDDKDYNPKGTFALFRYFQSNLMYRQPVEVVLATLGFFTFLSSRRKNWPMFFACTWWLAGVAVMTNITPDPLRYRLIVWPAVVILASCFWARLANGFQDQTGGWPGLATVLGLGIVLGSIAVYLGTVKLHHSVSIPLQLAVFIVATVAAYSIVAALRRIEPQIVASTLALLLVMVNVPQWIAGERHVSYELAEAAARLDKYPANYVLGGGWGVRLGFSSTKDIYMSWTPEAKRKVDLYVEDKVSLSDIPFPWHEMERHTMRRVPLEIVFVRIDR